MGDRPPAAPFAVRHHLRLLLAVLLVLSLTSCGVIRGAIRGCEAAPEDLLKEVMSHAKENFRTGDFITDRIELVRSGVIDLPADVAGSSNAQLLALTFVPKLRDPAVPGFEVDVTGSLLLDGAGRVVGPVDEIASLYFDYPTPREPGWAQRARAVDASEEALDLFECVQR